MTVDRDRAQRFRLALARGYSDYCRRSEQPTRLESLAAWFDKNAFWTGVAWMGLLIPCVSSPWWSEAFRSVFGPVIVWMIAVLFVLCLASAAISFILSIWQQCRDYKSAEETWRRR